jgi:hypothetical protein
VKTSRYFKKRVERCIKSLSQANLPRGYENPIRIVKLFYRERRNLLTYLLTPWSRVLLEKLTGL